MREATLSLAALLALGSAALVGYEELTRSFVVNLKDPHPVEGTVEVGAPISHSATQDLAEVVVAPARREEPSLWTEAGLLDTAGFTSLVLSLHGQFRGPELPWSRGPSPGARGQEVLVVRHEHEILLGRVLEDYVVVFVLNEDIDRTLDLPATLEECTDKAPSLSASSGGRTFRATLRPSFVSSAR